MAYGIVVCHQVLSVFISIRGTLYEGLNFRNAVVNLIPSFQ
jgi:hypothetical protein